MKQTRLYTILIIILLLIIGSFYYYRSGSTLDVTDKSLAWDISVHLFLLILLLFRGNLIQKNVRTTQEIGVSFAVTNILILLFLFGVKFYIHKISEDIDYLIWFDTYFNYRIALVLTIGNLLTVLHYTFKNLNHQHHNETPKIVYESSNKDAELYKLRQQINPHFLFNALNSINALLQFDKEKAREMIVNLSQYYRNTININEQEWHSIAQELEDILLYFNIEKIRFGHRLHLDLQCPDALKNYRVPPLLFQPLVENAIKHGLYGSIGDIKIAISIYETTAPSGKQFITFQIDNPFDHNNATKAQGTGFGLDNIKRRMYLLFATYKLFKTYTVVQNEQTSIFKAFISIPINKKES